MNDLRDYQIHYAHLYTEDKKKKFLDAIKGKEGAERTRLLYKFIMNAFLDGVSLVEESEKMKKVASKFQDLDPSRSDSHPDKQ